MSMGYVLDQIDMEIEKLQTARRALGGDDTEPTTVRRKYTKRFNPVSKGLARSGKRTMSEEGKKRVAEAQRKRWAATKKEAK
jgi:predicted ABC-type ATPase